MIPSYRDHLLACFPYFKVNTNRTYFTMGARISFWSMQCNCTNIFNSVKIFTNKILFIASAVVYFCAMRFLYSCSAIINIRT